MALFAIGDPHLSLGADKPMDVFGGAWTGYVDKLTAGFQVVGEEDTVVLCGDISWGMSLEQAEKDFAFLDALPGKRKLLLKGNHDYWWTTAAKMTSLFCGAWLPDPGAPPQQLPFLWGDRPVRDPGVVL